jgi:hypothetical protein
MKYTENEIRNHFCANDFSIEILEDKIIVDKSNLDISDIIYILSQKFKI